MASEIERVNFGMTEKGQVVMIVKDSLNDDGTSHHQTYTVKHGAHTIGEYKSRKAAETIAKTLGTAEEVEA